ncbi:MAG: hypothetical protein HYS27_22815 [Deltaproteobacteria bacterium]|nr:hypothetical protein [Deltaproteobacteria bacterium]
MAVSLWNQAGVPHKGWTEVDVVDLDEPAETCGMCRSAQVRYIHVMVHADYADALRVGVHCAERMADDYAGVRETERWMRRRTAFSVKEWKRERPSGRSFLRSRKKRATVLLEKRAGGWYVLVEETGARKPRGGRKAYPSERAARMAVYEWIYPRPRVLAGKQL